MEETTSPPSSGLSRGLLYLFVAVLIFASANAVVKHLVALGEKQFAPAPNPISFCNVLFVGNLCAALVLFCLYRSQCSRKNWQALTRSDWGVLSAAALLSGALGPMFFFLALAQTTATNVVLIGRIEPPLVLGLGVLLLGEGINRWQIIGAVVSFIGVVIIVLLPLFFGDSTSSFQLGKGEIMALLGAICLSISTIVSKLRLAHIPLGLFSIFRTLVGALIFLIIVIIWQGLEHFMDVFSPFLWQWMIFYGAIVVAIGQLLWFSGLKRTRASDASLASSFTPIAGVGAAFLILGEIPSLAQYLGGGVIMVGIVMSQISSGKKAEEEPASAEANPADDVESGLGFKGV